MLGANRVANRRRPLAAGAARRLALLGVLFGIVLAVQSTPGSEAAAARYRTKALLSRVLIGNFRARHLALLVGHVDSRYPPCKRKRVVRFYHRVNGKDHYLGRALGRRKHRTGRTGLVVTISKTGKRARRGTYYMTVNRKTLRNGVTCLPARSKP